MLIVLSPAKTLDYSSTVTVKKYSHPVLLKESAALIKILRGLPEKEIGKLMDISPKLAALNAQRFQDFSTPFTPQNARQALLAFKGDVYAAMDVSRYTPADFDFAQAHLRILSGLYGILAPLDLMQPYRLEMGTALKNARGKDLYAFWGERISKALNDVLAEEGSGVLVNLASEEYFKSVRTDALKADILHVHFKERRGNKLQTIGLLAKRARGRMADFIIRERIRDVNDIQHFTGGGYRYDNTLSSAQTLVFVGSAS